MSSTWTKQLSSSMVLRARSLRRLWKKDGGSVLVRWTTEDGSHVHMCPSPRSPEKPASPAASQCGGVTPPRLRGGSRCGSSTLDGGDRPALQESFRDKRLPSFTPSGFSMTNTPSSPSTGARCDNTTVSSIFRRVFLWSMGRTYARARTDWFRVYTQCPSVH